MSSLPRDWDGALEEFLNSSMQRASKVSNISWDQKTLKEYSNTKTLIEAINVNETKEMPIKERTRTYKYSENRIKTLINHSLSPRKNTIIPCSRNAIKQRDKQRIETIFRERNRPINNERNTLHMMEEESSRVSRDLTSRDNENSINKNHSDTLGNSTRRSLTSCGFNVARKFPIPTLLKSTLPSRIPNKTFSEA